MTAANLCREAVPVNVHDVVYVLNLDCINSFRLYTSTISTKILGVFIRIILKSKKNFKLRIFLFSE